MLKIKLKVLTMPEHRIKRAFIRIMLDMIAFEQVMRPLESLMKLHDLLILLTDVLPVLDTMLRGVGPKTPDFCTELLSD